MDKLLAKYEALKEYIANLERVAVAYSSGVDSTFLLYAAKEALGDNVIAITAKAVAFPKRESSEAELYCKELGIRQINVDFDPFTVDDFSSNPKNRCYICKRALFSEFINVAKAEGIGVILEGSNVDDMGDYRPGLKAIEELGIYSPLKAVGFTKDEIRSLSKYLNIPTWSKPSFACLASRFPYGDTISKEKLKMVENAEDLLLNMGFKQFRVRIHGLLARIEVLPEDIGKLMEESNRLLIHNKLKEYGFDYVAVDMLGYRTGSMNETIIQ